MEQPRMSRTYTSALFNLFRSIIITLYIILETINLRLAAS